MKTVRSFEGLGNSPLDSSRFVDGCMNSKKRGVGKLTSLETASKELKTGNGNDSETNDNDKSNNSNNNDLDTTSSRSESSSVGDKGGKAMEVLSRSAAAEEEEAERSLTTPCASHGMASVIGRRRVMEDAVAVAIGEIDSYDFFAVYDGHGGARVANSCRERMHRLVAEEMMMASGGGKEGGEVVVDWQKVMTVSFEKMDAEVSSVGSYGDGCEGWVNTVGSTAVVVMVGKEVVVVANCGDSRAVLCRGGVAVPLSHDHKPDRPDERERVEAAGGRVVNWNSSRVLGVLATSRSIGDHYLKPYVIAEPEVTVSARTGSDDFLIIASDGLWDVVSNEVACEVVRRCFNGRIKRNILKEFSENVAAEAATILAELALARGSRDNISVIVVELNKSICCS